MNLRLLTLTICLGSWAAAPAVGLAVSVHSLEYHSAESIHSVDPFMIASHGHHHEIEDPAHSHEIVRSVEGPAQVIVVQAVERRASARLSAVGIISSLLPTGLPPPEPHKICVMLL